MSRADLLRQRLASETDFLMARRLLLELELAEQDEETLAVSSDARCLPQPEPGGRKPRRIDPSRDLTPAQRRAQGWR